MPSGNCKKNQTFDSERRTVQKITFCLFIRKPLEPENFSFSIPFSKITHEHLKINHFSTSYEHKDWGKNKKLGGRRWKVGQTWQRNNHSRPKKYNKNIETLLAKQISSLLIWDRPLKFLLQHPNGCVPPFEQLLAALASANSQLSFISFFFLHNDDIRDKNQIDKVACSFVRARFGRRSAGMHRSDRCGDRWKMQRQRQTWRW